MINKIVLILTDTSYENVKEGQDWWKTVDLPGDQKELVGRTNAIRLYKVPLEE
jgi:2,3-dihydroxybenzoate decarboxylase